MDMGQRDQVADRIRLARAAMAQELHALSTRLLTLPIETFEKREQLLRNLVTMLQLQLDDE